MWQSLFYLYNQTNKASEKALMEELILELFRYM